MCYSERWGVGGLGRGAVSLFIAKVLHIWNLNYHGYYTIDHGGHTIWYSICSIVCRKSRPKTTEHITKNWIFLFCTFFFFHFIFIIFLDDDNYHIVFVHLRMNCTHTHPIHRKHYLTKPIIWVQNNSKYIKTNNNINNNNNNNSNNNARKWIRIAKQTFTVK